MTLKNYLQLAQIENTPEQRFKLGYKIARIWDAARMGQKIYVEELDLKVRDYPLSFIDSKGVVRTIRKFFKL